MREIPVVLEDGGWLSLDAEPAARALGAVQVCHARVGTEAAARRFTIFFTNARWPHDWSVPDAFGAIAAARGGAPVFYSDASGEDEATMGSTDPADLDAVAAAGAVFRASWGWDERVAIPVVVNGLRRVCEPRFDGRSWRAGAAG